MATITHKTFYDSADRPSPLRGAFRDLYRYRALIRMLVSRDLTVRYKRSLFGVSWTVLNPLLQTIVMWLVFNHLFHFAMPGRVPYLVYLLAGVLVVNYFGQSVLATSASMAASASTLTKVYVPAVVFAFSAACSGAVNFLFGMVPLAAFELVLGPGLRWSMLLVPVPLVFLLAMIAGIGLFLATYVIRFDDILNLINVLLMLVGYLTPTFWVVTIIPSHYEHLLYLNALFSYVTVFRYLDYGGAAPSWICVPIIVLTGTLGLLFGLAIFVRRWPSLAVLL